MWQAFKDDIEMTAYKFKNREEFNNWVRAWVEDSINECGRIERYYLGHYNPTTELDIEIGEDNG